jgi:hypothetical protein
MLAARYDSAMPNGHDKNWVRLCAAVDGFRMRYGHWPIRVRMPAICMNDFRYLFTERDLLAMTAKVQLVLDDASFVAEDDEGGRYCYGEEGFPDQPPRVSAREWFGVSPKAESEIPDVPWS